MTATDTHATIEELLEAVFSVRSLPRLYNESQLQLETSLQTAVTRVRVSCEMAASLRGVSPGAGECPLVKTQQTEKNYYVQ
jgi:hypothetical protein